MSPIERPRECIATSPKRSEAERIKALLHDLGVTPVWVTPLDLGTGELYGVLVHDWDARGAYVRLKRAGEHC